MSAIMPVSPPPFFPRPLVLGGGGWEIQKCDCNFFTVKDGVFRAVMADSQVAKIAADAMNNYMMFKQKLEVSVVPTERIHPELWKGANKKFRPFPYREVARQQHNAPRSAEQQVLQPCRHVLTCIGEL